MVAVVVTGVSRDAVERVSATLFALGAAGLQEDWLPGEAPPPRQPWDTGPPAPAPDRVVLRAWIDGPDVAAIEAAVAGSGSVAWEEVEDRDWDAEWRAGFGPIEVAPGWVLAPPWDAPPGALIVEPGQGFGTGLHPSTRMALRGLLATGCTAGTALDIGCGSGVLAIAAARLGLRATGIDVEAGAVRDAERNAALNGVSCAFSTTTLEDVPGTFDVVLANLHAELLVALRDPIVGRTGEALVMAGILADRADGVVAAYAPRLRLVGTEREDEWVALRWAR
jgi:ribosomal protein L11 methyltransferase